MKRVSRPEFMITARYSSSDCRSSLAHFRLVRERILRVPLAVPLGLAVFLAKRLVDVCRSRLLSHLASSRTISGRLDVWLSTTSFYIAIASFREFPEACGVPGAGGGGSREYFSP